ncbi:MFS transporter [Nocardioides panzhihuensis]|uniref:AAHS family benzoate transporter-like MFS transporter n=1 Tax=Nocardioides panzhihuensis TaxID=860243 RepID=A0A7Z0ITG5_9ACTN|nr:aromatic acid/H+ symport family MFS transporter [Nocardioides panzhihuensis]NYI79129.1 AAHS family benzoate transporter-like MFS transporter [Nocardioides panzhihuensis]
MSTVGRTAGSTTVARRSPLVIVAVAFAAIVLDGYDLMVYGAMIPELLAHPTWDLSKSEAGMIGSYTTLGMLVGALAVGALADILGRRRLILLSIGSFSLATVATAMAPTPELFGLFRLLAGIGLGGVMPTAIALTVEYAPPGKKQLYNAAMFIGYAFGGVFAAIAALIWLESAGFRTLLWIGAIPGLLLLPIVYKLLPESVGYLRRRGLSAQADALAEQYGLVSDDPTPGTRDAGGAIRYLLGPGRIVPLALFSVASFSGLLLVYGLNTWLPQIMRSAGYPLGSAISFLLVLNLGAVVGTVAAGALADRLGEKIAVALCFLAATVTLLTLAYQPPTGLLYVCVAVAGLGSIGTQILVNGYAAAYFPAWTRSTAVGITLGLGRVGAVVAPSMIGFVMDADLGFRWNFYSFVIPAVLGLVMILLVPARRRVRGATPARL